ncbi:Lrp/AsnC family transcriptional regulator [Candidatus Micrarchaeota archaeon]|nr:Lrp/AsnC family transcriptional regulator [Candidatus Micrarchaeota archaeon]
MVRISNIKLIKELMKNSRIKYVELAKMFGVTETAVRKKIHRLEEDGVIIGYTVIIDPKILGYNVDALIGLDTTPESYLNTLERLTKMDKVISVYSSSGDHMILIRVWLKDYRELSRFVRRLEGMEGVTRVCPATIIEKIK